MQQQDFMVQHEGDSKLSGLAIISYLGQRITCKCMRTTSWLTLNANIKFTKRDPATRRVSAVSLYWLWFKSPMPFGGGVYGHSHTPGWALVLTHALECTWAKRRPLPGRTGKLDSVMQLAHETAQAGNTRGKPLATD